MHALPQRERASMSSSFTATGATGEIRVGGRVAAQIGKWQLMAAGGNAYTVIGPTVEVNEFLLFGENKKELRLPVGAKEWRWRDVSVGFDGSQVTVVVTGKPDVR
jgi:hypothetical protein